MGNPKRVIVGEKGSFEPKQPCRTLRQDEECSKQSGEKGEGERSKDERGNLKKEKHKKERQPCSPAPSSRVRRGRGKEAADSSKKTMPACQVPKRGVMILLDSTTGKGAVFRLRRPSY